MDYWILAQLCTPLLASEGSGDSESDMELVDDHGLPCMQERAADDDDAESCSHESHGRAQIEHGSDDGGESDDGADGDDDGARGVDHEKGVFVWLKANAREKKEDKEVKVVDSEDDDRLFWETCLATGY
ncbi:putative phosphopantothenoylcysteine decarboxylase subunit VHS3 [Cocos nucifera]|uniref:Putative phosphopantothenoylcysteine decarboxylase subunit VHS3 n=1 Tax=Cocos nucifera TaxID=13894 RepID=A0A8K0I625_COCNU|nr:putative phosphopantothenoylcysteine decarboxylase subunit VHS3 [Cocos nucifera]